MYTCMRSTGGVTSVYWKAIQTCEPLTHGCVSRDTMKEFLTQIPAPHFPTSQHFHFSWCKQSCQEGSSSGRRGHICLKQCLFDQTPLSLTLHYIPSAFHQAIHLKKKKKRLALFIAIWSLYQNIKFYTNRISYIIGNVNIKL